MKRAINKWLWPYMSVSLFNEHQKICLACEGILCGEWRDAYNFLCQFLINHDPGQLPTEVLLVTGDGLFNKKTVNYFGFVIAKYLMDWFHIFDTGLTDTFRENGCDLIWGEPIKIIKSHMKEYFDAYFSNARMIFSNQQQQDMDLETKLEDFDERKF